MFYRVAKKLLPPGGDQKYTHRYPQYIQTDLKLLQRNLQPETSAAAAEKPAA